MPEQSQIYAPVREIERATAPALRGGLHRGTSGCVSAWSAARSPLSLSLLCLVVLLLSTRGITSEGTVSLQGDMPRYLMNGTYFFDLLHDWPLTHLIEYTYRYYARYPALSLGHHPLLLGLAEVPFDAVFGVSVFAGRLTVVSFMLVGIIAWFRLIELIYDREVALFSALLLATTPFVVGYSRIVISEIPALAMVLVATYYFHRYSETLRLRDALLFAVTTAASVYAKHHCVFMLPIFLAYLLVQRGLWSVLNRTTLLALAIVVVLVAPLVPITVEFSRMNVNWVQSAARTARFSVANLRYYVAALWTHYLTAPVFVLALISLAVSIWRRDRRVRLFVLWIVLFYLEITYMAARDLRFAIYWIPPFCLLAASCMAHVQYRRWKVAVVSGLVMVVSYQFITAAGSEPEYADGFEKAAQYVLEHRKGDSVLFSGEVDSGFFIFFMRKHDPRRSMVVLRADKTLVTSSLARIIATQLTTREQIHAMLRDFGTAYVVMEDAPYHSPPLELLRQDMRTDAFVLRDRIPIRSNSALLKGVDLVVYEYLGHTPAAPDRPLQMRIPLMGRDIAVRFGELLETKPGDTASP